MRKLFLHFVAVSIALASCTKADSNLSAGNSAAAPGMAAGQGGSLARFTIAQGYLYTVDHQVLSAYSLEQPSRPQMKSTTSVGMEVETIYPFEDKLFIGSQSAMYIYSVANPARPKLLGQAQHVRACDPVVANGTFAYVTVRSGSNCGGSVNALIVYDVKNPMQPVKLAERGLSNPQGLGLSGNRLYVCDGSAGLILFDLSNPSQPNKVGAMTGLTFHDVIITGNLIVAMVDGGMALIRIKTDGNLELVSKMSS